MKATAGFADAKGPVFFISDKLGLAIGKRSILDFIYEKWGAIIGAKKLDAVAIRNLGPKVTIFNLKMEAIAASIVG